MQFSLKDIRVISRKSENEVAKYCGITIDKVREYENNPGLIPASIAIKMRELFGIPIDFIII